jgi:hypothetical protein
MLGHVQERVRAALATITVSLAAFGCNADTPSLSDGSVDGPPCSPFADQLVAFTPGTGGASDAGEAALGPPDDEPVVVGVDASLTLRFAGAGALADDTGDELQIYATATADAAAVAYVSEDGEEFRFAADLSVDNLLVDLANASASRAEAFRVIGVAGELAIDAVEALTIDCNSQ